MFVKGDITMRLHAEVTSDYNARFYNQYTDGKRYLLKQRISESDGMVASIDCSGHDTINHALVAAQKVANMGHILAATITLPDGNIKDLC